MAESIQSHLDDYLKIIEREVKAVLERFESVYSSYNMTTDKDFISDILEITVNSVFQICKLFEMELKLKKCDVPNVGLSYANTLKNVAMTSSTDTVPNQELNRQDRSDAMSVSSSHAGPAEDTLDPKDALTGQKKILNSIYVKDLPLDMLKDEQFRNAVIQKLCKKANVPYKDFREAFLKKDALIIKFHRLESKEKMFDYGQDRDIWTNELYDLPKGQNPHKITICHYMTQFYSKLWFKAQYYKNQDRLHSFKLTENGLAVKRKPQCAEKIFLTKQELTDYVNK